MKLLSIVIVTYQSEHDIYDCLESIWQYADIPLATLEVIVVDNSPKSEPMFSTIQDRYGTGVRLIKNTHNGGYGQGNNIGIQAATAPYILVMNPDVRLIEPVFSAAIKFFEANPSVGILGMKQMDSNGKPSRNSFSCTYMMNGYLSTIMSSLGNRFDIYSPRHMHVSGACFFLRKDMFEEIEMFDSSNFLYGEEDDIHYRMRKRYGDCTRYTSHLHYIHLTKATPTNIEYWKKVLDAAIRLNEKKGYPARQTIINRLRNNRFLILRQNIRKVLGQPTPMLPMLKEYHDYLKQMLNETQV